MRDCILARCSSGELATTSPPRAKYLSFASGVLRNRTISSFSRLMTAAGVLAGAYIASIPTISYPGTPEAAIVGKPAISADGCALVTAKALNLPDLTCGDTKNTPRKANCTSPLTTAMVDGEPPL